MQRVLQTGRVTHVNDCNRVFQEHGIRKSTRNPTQKKDTEIHQETNTKLNKSNKTAETQTTLTLNTQASRTNDHKIKMKIAFVRDIKFFAKSWIALLCDCGADGWTTSPTLLEIFTKRNKYDRVAASSGLPNSELARNVLFSIILWLGVVVELARVPRQDTLTGHFPWKYVIVREFGQSEFRLPKPELTSNALFSNTLWHVAVLELARVPR